MLKEETEKTEEETSHRRSEVSLGGSEQKEGVEDEKMWINEGVWPSALLLAGGISAAGGLMEPGMWRP